MIKIALVDDNPAIIFGVQSALKRQEGIIMDFYSSDAVDFLEKAMEYPADVFVIDIVMDDVFGFNFLEEIRNKFPNQIIIAYSNAQGSSIELSLERIGINKLVSKKDPLDVLLQTIVELVENHKQIKSEKRKATLSLTEREIEVIHLLGKGFSSPDIALTLNISHNTVNFYKKKLLKKFGVESITQLIRDAVEIGICRD